MTASLSGIASVIGVGQTDWVGDHALVRAGDKQHDSYGYAAQAFVSALADSGIDRAEIDGLIVGPTTAYERVGEMLGLDVRWGGQADAMTAVMEACMAIHAGLASVVALVYGNDQRSAQVNYGGPDAQGGGAFMAYVYHAPWGFTSQGALYAMMARRYMHERGMTEADLGEVAVAQRLAASRNPGALMRRPIDIDDYLASPFICEPLHLFDYCLINDGGVALIVAEAGKARRIGRAPVSIRGIGRYDLNRGATSLEPRLLDFYHSAQKKVATQVFDMASLGPEDMDALQIYDSFSLHIPLALEGYGYCAVGEAGRYMRENGISLARGLPVNTSGGHLSESYMQGWNHQIEAVRQIRGEAGERQVGRCRHVHYSSDVAGKAISIIYGA